MKEEAIWKKYNELKIGEYPFFKKEDIDVKEQGLWRYWRYLPVDKKDKISMGEGFTPLLPIRFGNNQVYIKQEQLFPTGSYKDRGAAVLMSVVANQGIRFVVQDSSGNAGCAIAAYAAKAGIECEIFVPADTSEAKLAQIRMYGARLTKVEGSREDTANAALKAADSQYYASHCYNPLFLEGTKTFAYEVFEQLDWASPTDVVLPAGNGTLLLGAFIGFKHLKNSGLIKDMPRLHAVQSAACCPLYEAWVKGDEVVVATTGTYTLAEGIAIADPVRGSEMLQAVRETNGEVVKVSEEEIGAALLKCCKMGYYIEPTSAATIAGLLKLIERGNNKQKKWVSLFSGHGLKSTTKMMSFLDDAH